VYSRTENDEGKKHDPTHNPIGGKITQKKPETKNAKKKEGKRSKVDLNLYRIGSGRPESDTPPGAKTGKGSKAAKKGNKRCRPNRKVPRTARPAEGRTGFPNLIKEEDQAIISKACNPGGRHPSN